MAGVALVAPLAYLMKEGSIKGNIRCDGEVRRWWAWRTFALVETSMAGWAVTM
jgi:hypothetical protein